MSDDRSPASRRAPGRDAAIRIVPMTRDMLAAIADLHHRSFGTRLGRRYSLAFVAWYLTRKDAIAIAAVDASGQPVGYVVGAVEGHEAALQRDIRSTVVIELTLRPWRWFDPYIIGTILARLRTSPGAPGTPHPSPAGGGASAPGSPALSLVAIGVSPSVRGRGVGALLMESFEARARALGAGSMILWVRKDNDAARRLYERCGWIPRETGHGGGDTGTYIKRLA